MISGYAKTLPHLIWVAIVFALYGAVFYVFLPPQFESRGIFFTDEILLITLSILVYYVIKQPNWEWKYVGLFLTLFVFALPLLRLWNTAESTWNIILGLLPWADAEGYYTDAHSLINGGLFGAFSGRRPLFASLLAVLMKLSSQNLQLVLIIFAAMNALAVFLFALEIHRQFGPVAAVATVYISQIFYRPYAGTTLTEQLGFPIGLLAYAILIRCVKVPHRIWFALGLMLLTFALLVRAGAFFVLLVPVAYGSFVSLRKGQPIWRTSLVLIIAILFPLIINIWLGRAVASRDALPFGNFAYTLYGQAVEGRRWTQVILDHPDLATLEEPERSQKIYRLAFEEIRKNPFGVVKGSIKAWRDFFLPSAISVFSFLDVGNKSINLIIQIIASLLSLWGIWISWHERQNPVHGFILASTLGIIISIPFLPPIDAGIRPYAATMAVIFLPILVAVSRLSGGSVSESPPADTRTAMIAASYGLCLIAAAVFGGFFLKVTARSPIVQAGRCPPGFVSAHIEVNQGSYVLLVESNSMSNSRVPVILLKDVLKSFDEFPYGDFASIVRKIKQPVLITLTNDLSTGKQFWIIAPPELKDAQGRIVSVCGMPVSDLYPVLRVATLENP